MMSNTKMTFVVISSIIKFAPRDVKASERGAKMQVVSTKLNPNNARELTELR